MSANDSSTLIDTPAASKLGENRALYYSEEENRIEKFRPYGLPEAEWLEQVKQHFAARPVPDVPVPVVGNGAADGAGVRRPELGAGLGRGWSGRRQRQWIRRRQRRRVLGGPAGRVSRLGDG